MPTQTPSSGNTLARGDDRQTQALKIILCANTPILAAAQNPRQGLVQGLCRWRLPECLSITITLFYPSSLALSPVYSLLPPFLETYGNRGEVQGGTNIVRENEKRRKQWLELNQELGKGRQKREENGKEERY